MNCKYPNLAELIKYHPYPYTTFAQHANVTAEIFQAVLNGEDDLSPEEALNMCTLDGLSFELIFSDELCMLTQEDAEWVEDLSRRANKYHSPSMQKAVDKLVHDYIAGHASYCQLLGASARVRTKEIEEEVARFETQRRGTKLSA